MSSDDKEYKNLPNSFATLMEQAKRTFLLREHAALVKQATEDNARRSRLAQSFAHMTAQLNPGTWIRNLKIALFQRLY